jgi:CheY-like chemotaxis protein
MPGLNGIDLLKKIKDSNRFVRTILTTAFEIDDNIDDNLFQEYTEKRIIDGYLQKPISVLQLIKEVNIQLDSYEAQKNYRY